MSDVDERRAKVQAAVARVAELFAHQRQERLRRNYLEKVDFDALAEAGFLLTGVPADEGGLWTDLKGSIRSYASCWGRSLKLTRRWRWCRRCILRCWPGGWRLATRPRP